LHEVALRDALSTVRFSAVRCDPSIVGSLEGKFLPLWAFHRHENVPRIQDYLDAAVQCEERAAMASDPASKDTFVVCARCWRELARCWGELTRLLPLPDNSQDENHTGKSR
jgi:hypothetical protein